MGYTSALSLRRTGFESRIDRDNCQAPMMELVDFSDSKSEAEMRVGSSPTWGTKLMNMKERDTAGLSEFIDWRVRCHSHFKFGAIV